MSFLYETKKTAFGCLVLIMKWFKHVHYGNIDKVEKELLAENKNPKIRKAIQQHFGGEREYLKKAGRKKFYLLFG